MKSNKSEADSEHIPWAMHTPGPWVTVPNYTSAPAGVMTFRGDSIADVFSGIEGDDPLNEQAEANAQRIVACVNACEGIADPSALPEALAALKRIMAHFCFIQNGPDFPDAWAAIAKAEINRDRQ